MVTNMLQMTVEEYLAFDETSEIRNEYIDGAIMPMSGGTGNHSAIIAIIIARLFYQLEDADCIVRSSDMRVRIDATKYVYPDVSVVCGDSIFEDENATVLLNPTVVVEVTSPSSIAHDHVDKVAYYGAVPSIQGYLVLDQTRVFAEWYTRAVDGGWHIQQFSSQDDVIPLDPLGGSLALAQIYRGIALDD